MQHLRYQQEEIDELCRLPPWTDSSLDVQTKLIHDQVPLTRKCIVNQCLFWCDVAKKFKMHMQGRRVKTEDGGESTAPEGSFIVGVIGCGSVGSKFVRELIKKDIVKPNQIRISSRTPSRAKQRCGLEVVQNNADVASHCTILFLFVLPFHFRNFSREIRDAIQGTRPLVVSSLAGFTPLYLQRALNTPFLITTGVDMQTIMSVVPCLDDEFPLARFATAEEIAFFRETALGMTDVAQEEQTDKDQPQPPQLLPQNTVFMKKLANPKLTKQLYEAAFAAESLNHCSFDFLSVTVAALKDWVSIDGNHAKIVLKPETYNRLWSISFIPLSSLAETEQGGSSPTPDAPESQVPLRLMVKRAFVRSLLGQRLLEYT